MSTGEVPGAEATLDARLGPALRPPLGLLDSGTTRTRLRVWDGERVCWQGERRIGARDVARAGHPDPLLGALRELLGEVPRGREPRALVCSGMVTSNVGLMEVPHVPAPAGAAEVARGVRRAEWPGLPPALLIPGILTPPAPGPEGWHAADVLRGEEVEVFGLREVLGLREASDFLHLGSHHKWLQLDARGRVTRSATSLAGEALAALGQHTVLAGSVPPLGETTSLDPQAWADGLQAARRLGAGRALFLVRVGQQLGPLSREQAGAFLHGVLACLTLDALRASDPATPLVIYGHAAQARLLAQHLSAGGRSVRVCGGPCVADATVRGALSVLRAAGVLEGVGAGDR